MLDHTFSISVYSPTFSCSLSLSVTISQSLFSKLTPAKSIGVVEYREERPPSNECPGYDTKSSDDEASVLELWGMGSTSSLTLLPGPH